MGSTTMFRDESATARPGRRLVIALAGNPNSGKTTLFNAVTGARQHVGNYPGVTVEKKEGEAEIDGRPLHVIDLPGAYSLTAHTTEEVIARNVILEDRPDVVIDIVDASNLERNLYLATQLLELGVPLVLAFNMSDVARTCGVEIDAGKLSALLGVPIVETVGHKGRGVAEMLRSAATAGSDPASALAAQRRPHYGTEIEPHVEDLAGRVARSCGDDRHARWLALKLLEGDEQARQRLFRLCPAEAEELCRQGERLGEHLRRIFGAPPETILAERRYGFISGACGEAVRRGVERRHDLSDRIDAILTHRWLGLPIFAALMYAVFTLTFSLGEPPMNAIDWAFGLLAERVSMLWPRGSESVLRSLLVDGVIGGVGGVIVFLPNILLLFLAIAFLEDTGYMARAAFIMDRLMHRLGLHGKSFIPMLIGFGCSVPAILATRTLETRRDRLTTMLVVPLMSCGARFPIYALIIPAFFAPAWRGPMLWGIYLAGIALAVACARLLRATVLRGETTPFVMELPPYRMPTLRGLAIHVWERGGLYLRKAGTIILAASILLWAAGAFPRDAEAEARHDARVEKAWADYFAAARNAGAWAGDGPSPLLGALCAEADARRAGEKFWPHEAGYRAAGEARDTAIAHMLAWPGGERLAAFLRTRDAVVRARAAFGEMVEAHRLREGTPEYLAAENRLQRDLAAAWRESPEVFEAVVKHLDEVQAPLENRLTELAHARQMEKTSHSLIGRIGRAIEPALRPIGFDWRIGTALVGALAAKEVFVSQLGIVYSLGGADEKSDTLRAHLRADYTPLTALCIMLFALISAPCAATLAVTWRESGSWKWAALQFFGLTALAYIVAAAVHQIGNLLV